MYSCESSHVPCGRFHLVFPRTCLPPRVIYLRKFSQEKHVNRMKVAHQKKEMRPPQDLYSSVSNPKRRTRSSSSPFKTQRGTGAAATSIELNHTEKIMNFPTKLNCSYTIIPKLQVSDSYHCSKPREKLIPSAPVANGVNKNDKHKMETTRNSPQRKKSILRNPSSKIKNSPNENENTPEVPHLGKEPTTVTSNIDKISEIVTTKYQKHHSTSELCKNESKYDKVTSISEITLDSTVFRNKSTTPCKSANASKNTVLKPLDSDAGHSSEQCTKNESRIRESYVDKEDKAPIGENKKFPKVSKIPISLTRLSIKKEKSNLCDMATKDVFLMDTSRKDTDFMNSVNPSNDNKGGSIPKTRKQNAYKKPTKLENKKRVGNRRPSTPHDGHTSHVIDDFHDCNDGKRVGIALEIVPRKISSISLWLESLENNIQDSITMLNHSKSHQSNMNPTSTFMKYPKFKQKNDKSSKGPKNPPEVSNITDQKCSSKKDDLESENSLDDYYEFDDTDRDAGSNFKKGFHDDGYEWTEGTEEDFSSFSKLDLNFKHIDNSMTTSDSFPSLDKPNYNNPSNFVSNIEEHIFNNNEKIGDKDEKIGDCSLDTPRCSQAQKKPFVPKRRKGTKSKRAINIKLNRK